MSTHITKKLPCGHSLLIRKRDPVRLRYLCQVCTQRRLEVEDRKYALSQVVMVGGKITMPLPSWHPEREKALYFRRKLVKI